MPTASLSMDPEGVNSYTQIVKLPYQAVSGFGDEQSGRWCAQKVQNLAERTILANDTHVAIAPTEEEELRKIRLLDACLLECTFFRFQYKSPLCIKQDSVHADFLKRNLTSGNVTHVVCLLFAGCVGPRLGWFVRDCAVLPPNVAVAFAAADCC